MHILKRNKKVFLVSKKVLNFLIEPIVLYKQISVSKCNSCPFNGITNKYSEDYCKNYCNTKYYNTVFVPKYDNIFHLKKPSDIVKVYANKNIIKKIRLKKLTLKKYTYATTLQSKLMLAYFCFANNKGIINLLSRKYLADFIGCSTKSIDNCNKVLKKYNLINYQINNKNELTVIINDFEEQHAEDGSGYIVMASNLFEKILNISHLHEMRIALKAILLYDANKHYGHKTCFSIERLKIFLPIYKQKKYKLRAFIKSILELFKNGLEAQPEKGTGIEFTIDDKYDGKVIRKKLTEKYTKSFKEQIVKKHKKVPKLEEKIKSLAALSLEYPFKKVSEILSAAPMDVFFKDIKGFASYIRYYVKKSLQLQEFFFEM